jgi:alanine dehydrogenase
VLKLARQGMDALATDSGLSGGLNVSSGKLIHRLVRDVSRIKLPAAETAPLRDHLYEPLQ